MNRPRNAILATLVAVAMLGMPSICFAQAAAKPATLPADPWPRDLSIPGAAVLVYQPQINKWEGNQIDFRAAVAIKPTGAKDETFGVVFATARTQVDKVARMVVFENLKITKSDFPTLPNHGAQYSAALQKRFGSDLKTISLDRLRLLAAADQAADGACEQRAAAGDRELFAGDPGAHRRCAAEAGARPPRARSA
jgi:hypothetical protein